MSAPTPEDTTLLGIPPELRLTIYDELFISSEPIEIRSQIHQSSLHTDLSNLAGSAIISSQNLLHNFTVTEANRELYDEAVRHFYANNGFLVDIPSPTSSDALIQ
jgi:hypothetical protein